MSEREFDVRHDRIRYELPRLGELGLDADPISVFGAWLDAAAAAGVGEPNAMVLATAGVDGRPRARTVLLRGYDESGFTFFTNYESTKGRHLAENPWASVCFSWLAIHRQVIVEGAVQKLRDDESDAYFASRPVDSQIASALSPQSSVIDAIEPIEAQMLREQRQHPDGIPRPPHWGGYRIVPELIELWQGNVGRLHDRFRFRREGGQWLRERLAP
ncbi:MAG: pyridoxamine 5'-phosphate oxidase [Cumulibacter sp.]